MRVAITRGVSPAIGACELTFLEREAIDIENARAQHSLYEGILEELGCRVEHLYRLEERRVGKECRSRWPPDH